MQNLIPKAIHRTKFRSNCKKSKREIEVEINQLKKIELYRWVRE